MISRSTIATVLVLATTAIPFTQAAESVKPLAITAKAPAVELPDFRGRNWKWDDLRGEKVTVVAFLGAECPLVKLYAGRLQELSKQYADKGVRLIGVNANQHDSLAEIGHFVRTNKITFPMLKDAGNRVADAYGAERTPEMFVLDAKGSLRYRGRIDDQYTYGLQKPKVTRAHLKEAIEELLAGKSVSVTTTKTVGCHIGRLLTPDPNSKVTYSNQVARILQKRCVSCHRPGEIAPFALQEYDEVVGWAEMIAEVVSEQRMPPWHANPEHDKFKFSNDASMTDAEKQTLLDWVDAGAPKGDPKQLPKPKTFADGWQIGKPDLIVPMSKKPFRVPAEGEVRYQYFAVDPGFEEDKWIKAAECRPGNRAVVHHIIVAARSPKDRNVKTHGTPRSAWISATAPGAPPQILPDGMAKRIPAGSRLIFQMHYTPNGTAQEDISSVGFIFADPKTVKKEVATQQAANSRLRIPPGDDNHEVKAYYPFKRDALLLTLFPHMHLRGKSFRYTLIYPDKREDVLLDVPHYDFNWQNGYRFDKPVLAPAGSTLKCTAHFDNSENNLANPDPTEVVRWGDQTWEEMMIGYFDMVLADQNLTNVKSSQRRTDKFLTQLKEAPFDPKPFAAKLDEALENQDSWRALGVKLQKAVPQLDRMDWSYADGDRLNVKRVVQSKGPARFGVPRVLPGKGLALKKYAEKGELVVNQSLRGLEEYDMQLMRAYYNSSLHIPTRRDGKDGLISFWSDERDAFPTEVVEALRAIVK